MYPTLSDPYCGGGKLNYNDNEIDLNNLIGKGSFGNVYACTRLINN